MFNPGYASSIFKQFIVLFLAIPASQSLKNYKKLDSGCLNTLRCHLGASKLILLDEISMVGIACLPFN